ncbi:uncharacterized protein LOC119087926 isoform X2 [Peromyscus leucopus]|uniref:uncharacterized protein LOC119087926 isoform X2 n=1 Tax=Peromyscus leucopus TaxID=10041 RepID=UPI0018857D84|nr:uncharacterized protein LOC119087926 isoform X2 [Peromyscus leucopus]
MPSVPTSPYSPELHGLALVMSSPPITLPPTPVPASDQAFMDHHLEDTSNTDHNRRKPATSLCPFSSPSVTLTCPWSAKANSHTPLLCGPSRSTTTLGVPAGAVQRAATRGSIHPLSPDIRSHPVDGPEDAHQGLAVLRAALLPHPPRAWHRPYFGNPGFLSQVRKGPLSFCLVCNWKFPPSGPKWLL